MSANNYQVGGNHYQRQAYQHWDFVIKNKIPYLEAQVIRYITRYRMKNGAEDLHKAKHYIWKMQEAYDEIKDLTPGKLNDDEILLFLNRNMIDGPAAHAISLVCVMWMDPAYRLTSTLLRIVGAIDQAIERLATEPGAGYVNQG